MNESIKNMLERRSIRAYKKDLVPQEALDVILEAGEYSPSGMGNGSLVMGNLMNAAHALGVDSCWIHRAREVFDSEEGKELKKQWGVPDEYIGIGHCVLGYRDCEYPTAKPRKEGFVIRV